MMSVIRKKKWANKSVNYRKTDKQDKSKCSKDKKMIKISSKRK